MSDRRVAANTRHNMREGGFTLIETLLALSIGAIALLLTAESLLLIFAAKEYQYAMGAVEKESRYALIAMGSDIRAASAIATPLPLQESSALEVTLGGESVTFELADGAIWKTRGAGGPERITGADVAVTSLSFTHLHPGPAPLIHISLTLASGGTETIAHREYAETFSASAAIRR